MASKTLKYLSRDQVFRITLSGLMPLTVHYMYYENNLVASSNIKPVGGNLGDPIKTDASGMISFDFYCNGGVQLDTTPYEQALSLSTKLVNPKQVTVANMSVATLPEGYETTFLSYASTMIRVETTTSETTVSVAAVIDYVENPWIGLDIGLGGP